MKGWTRIYAGGDSFKLSLLKHRLEADDIEVIVLNKQDSSYLFGEAELYVPNEHALRATHILSKLQEDE